MINVSVICGVSLFRQHGTAGRSIRNKPEVYISSHGFMFFYAFAMVNIVFFMHMACMYSSTLIFTVTMLNVHECIILLLLLFANAKTEINKE